MSLYLDDNYEFSDEFLHPLKMAKEVPSEEGATSGYITKRLAAISDLVVNFAAAKTHNLLDPLDTIEDYDDLFYVLPKPDCVRTWQKDRMFAEQRLSGVHPNWIRRCQKIDMAFELALNASLKKLVGPQLVNQVKADSLYVCDYRNILEDIPVGTWEGHQKYVAPCVGYFIWRSTQYADRGELVPVLIAINGTTVAPDSTNWACAKLHFQVADATVHETCSHLYGAHFSMEPIAVATGRYLPPTHPVRKLLAPHFKFLLFNNDLGKNRLVNPGGFVDRLLAPSLAGSLELVKRAEQTFDFTKQAFINDCVSRGVDNATSLPHYPYRDDGMLLWNAIGTYVSKFIAEHYSDDAGLSADLNLLQWWEALSSKHDANIKGVPTGRTIDNLVFILQRIIFTSGPYHAAVNFPQYEYMAFAPNMPLSAYEAFPATVLETLPPYTQVAKQLEIMEILTSYRHDQFGVYAEDDLETFSSREQEIIDSFQWQLDKAEKIIISRNKIRRVPYRYLLPSLVPNSTSV